MENETTNGGVLCAFSAEIREARKKKGLTQKALAEKLGIDRAQISRSENDIQTVSASKLRKIVEVGLGGKLEITIKL